MHGIPDNTTLLGDTGWLAGLVRRLVEEADVDDVVQETLRRAMTHPVRDRSRTRAFLAAVARNVVRRRALSDGRRRRREIARTAPADAAADTLDVVERLARQRAVVDAVLALDDPYRRTILLRYYEELGPTAIALREHVPEETVKSRLKRGLDRLRRALASAHGDERDHAAWSLALAPLAVDAPSDAIAPGGGRWAVAIAAATALLVIVAAVLLVPWLFSFFLPY